MSRNIDLSELSAYLSGQMNNIMEECEASTDVLQSQVDEAKERSQRETAELRRQLQEKGAELEKSRQAAKRLQEEVWYSLYEESAVSHWQIRNIYVSLPPLVTM